MMSRETDILDRAARATEEATANAIADARAAAQHRELNPKGRCHWCGEKVAEELIFCEGELFEPSDCAQDWHKAQAAKKRNGQ